ncbi:hypothetical protein F5884DRAFT_171926 [Xylogone sp. PMI_703]|nr:hypothetical protein F5884DRAFT_171926 [Xylogone sp. PMI_703]
MSSPSSSSLSSLSSGTLSSLIPLETGQEDANIWATAHNTWTPVYLDTAKCDICEQPNPSVIQRCDKCNLQLCQDCIETTLDDDIHVAISEELNWEPRASKRRKTSRYSPEEEMAPKRSSERLKSKAARASKTRQNRPPKTIQEDEDCEMEDYQSTCGSPSPTITTSDGGELEDSFQPVETVHWARVEAVDAEVLRQRVPQFKLKRRGGCNTKTEDMVRTPTHTATTSDEIGSLEKSEDIKKEKQKSKGKTKEKEKKVKELEQDKQKAWEENEIIQSVKEENEDEALEMMEAALALMMIKNGL